MRTHSIHHNTLGIIGIFLLLVPFTAWVLILFKQYELIKAKTYRLHVLICRTCLFLPLYAIFIWLSLVEPQLYAGLQIAFALVEGYSFYSMFGLIIGNMGGPAEALNTMRITNKPPYCSCCPTEPGVFYCKVLRALKYFLFLRVPVVIIASIGDIRGLKSLYLIATLVALAILIYAVVNIISFYENIYYLNLGHISKLITLKLSVGIIVIEGIIEMILEYAGMVCYERLYTHIFIHMHAVGVFDNLAADNGYTQDGTLIRWFCFIIMLQYILLSILCWNVWSADIAYTGTVRLLLLYYCV